MDAEERRPTGANSCLNLTMIEWSHWHSRFILVRSCSLWRGWLAFLRSHLINNARRRIALAALFSMTNAAGTENLTVLTHLSLGVVGSQGYEESFWRLWNALHSVPKVAQWLRNKFAMQLEHKTLASHHVEQSLRNMAAWIAQCFNPHDPIRRPCAEMCRTLSLAVFT